MMAMTRNEFEEKIGKVLSEHGDDVTADLSDELLAYWNGHEIAYVLVSETPTGSSYEEFVMNDDQWRTWRSWLVAWTDAPTFSVRPEVRNWLADEPPAESGE
ncbi:MULTISPECIES: hypothetical protein [Paraburkholderia]|jgi:hypothetical protein|nr:MULTISPECIES: hypothetical protein [Paraburkholderia]BEU26141.1 D-alanyl-lipoteichoic acid biosynthesis protein DltD [Paraburkholderia sp. 22B1P]GJG99506.1 hypothetical protein CBA19C8_03140 [Paraburkholderia terrae]GJH33476.1 hypothetical protein CBA19CS91_11985 [Paraburkholderia hospita]